MKLKLSVLIMQGDSTQNILSDDYIGVVVTDNGEFPSIYVSTKTIPETLQQLYSEFSNLDCRWASPILSNLRHEHGVADSEALYRVLIPEGTLSLKKGRLCKLGNLELEGFYVQSIIEQPRSPSQRF
jgi:hypothetical protein